MSALFSLVSVKGQRLLCRATIHCQPDDILGEVMTERDCCMNNPLGLAYSHGDQGEDCTPCIGECIYIYTHHCNPLFWE